MKYLIYGSGNAREHSTFMRLKSEVGNNVIFACYGSNGILQGDPNFFSVQNTTMAILLAKEKMVDMVLVLSPLDLLKGIADIFAKAGFKVFGVKTKLAQVEGSKVYAKSLMEEFGIDTPDYRVFHSFQKAKAFLEQSWIAGSSEYVIKSDRFLANASLRVSIPQNLEEAMETLYFLMVSSGMDTGSRYVILEKKVTGPELSNHIMFDGDSYLLFPAVQDYKKLYENDRGPNTDGIGSMASTIPVITDDDQKYIENRVIEPSLKAVSSVGDYRFFLYTGIIKTPQGINVLEYNTRPGNPEWSTLLSLLESSLEDLINYTMEKRLSAYRPVWRQNAVSLTVMATASGYPFTEKEYEEKIRGVENLDEDVMLVSDHTRKEEDALVVSGGRVFGLTHTTDSFENARKKIYANMERLSFKGMFYRDDIGTNGIRFR